MPSIKHVSALFCLLFLLFFFAGCDKSFRYKDVSTGMGVYEFSLMYPDAKELSGIDKEIISIRAFKRKPEQDIRTALYYFTDNKLASITLIFPEETSYEEVVENVTADNGQPIIEAQKMGAEITAWQKDNSTINMSKVPVETPVYLPGEMCHLCAIDKRSFVMTRFRKTKS